MFAVVPKWKPREVERTICDDARKISAARQKLATRTSRVVRSYGRTSGQNNFVALLEGDNGFFPVGRLAGLLGALAAEFSADIERVYFQDLHLEQILDRLADLHLVST